MPDNVQTPVATPGSTVPVVVGNKPSILQILSFVVQVGLGAYMLSTGNPAGIMLIGSALAQTGASPGILPTVPDIKNFKIPDIKLPGQSNGPLGS